MAPGGRGRISALRPLPQALPWVIDADDDSFVAIAGCATSPYSRYMVAVVRAPCRRVDPALDRPPVTSPGR
jgi:hypothetical protein